MRRLLALLGCLALVTAGSAAPATGPAGPAPATVDDQDAVLLRDLFDFQLPKLVWPRALRLTVSPLWRDVIDRDVVRVRTGLRYAFNRNLEASAEFLPYFDNLGGEGEGGLGVAEYRFGSKLAWNSLLDPWVETAFGFTVTLPDQAAPASLHIGTARYVPYVVFSRPWRTRPGWSSFVNLEAEIFDSNPAPGRIAPWRADRDAVSVTPGVLLHRAPWHYAFATSFTTTVDGDNRTFVSLRPTVSWEVPSRYTTWLPGRWVAGLGWETIFYDDGTEHRLNGRLKWDIDFRRLFDGRMPWNSRNPAPAPRSD